MGGHHHAQSIYDGGLKKNDMCRVIFFFSAPSWDTTQSSFHGSLGLMHGHIHGGPLYALVTPCVTHVHVLECWGVLHHVHGQRGASNACDRHNEHQENVWQTRARGLFEIIQFIEDRHAAPVCFDRYRPWVINTMPPIAVFMYVEPPNLCWDEFQCCICFALPVRPCFVPHDVDVPTHNAT